MCRPGQSTTAIARVVEVDYEDPEQNPIKEIHDVWALSVWTSTEQMENEIGGDNFSMIMDSGAEEHV